MTAAVRPPLLEVRGLCAWYGAAQVLFGLDLQVERGEVVALMGRNGAGKSTTLKTLMGLLPGRAGQVTFMGQEISHLASHAVARLGMGYVPEERRIFGELTVLENLDVGRQPARTWPDGVHLPAWTVQRVFDLFPNLAAMPTRRGAHMSGGEQQMLTVARTLMGNPYLVLLDEPSEGVAPIVVEQMAQAILGLKAHGVAVLLCEQNLAFASMVADRVCLLDQGDIRYRARMADFLADSAARDGYLQL